MRSVKAIYSFRRSTRTSQRGLRLLRAQTNLYWPVRVSPSHHQSAHELTIAASLAQTSLWWYSRSRKKKMLWGNIRGKSEHWYSRRACQSSLRAQKAGPTKKVVPQPIRGGQFTELGQLFARWFVWYQLVAHPGANDRTARAEQTGSCEGLAAHFDVVTTQISKLSLSNNTSLITDYYICVI